MELIKSKQRVLDHGEVYTSEREVFAMLNLVQQEAERIDSRFLEPACGTGNFLVEILKQKLVIVKRNYGKSQLEFERFSVAAISSIYGVDILEDNVQTCRERLFHIFNVIYTSLYKKKCKESCRNSVRFILGRNILWGDALSLKAAGEKSLPIVFSEWSFVRGSMIKRRDYVFAELIPDERQSLNLFAKVPVSDLGTPVFIPKPVGEFQMTHFLTLGDQYANQL